MKIVRRYITAAIAHEVPVGGVVTALGMTVALLCFTVSGGGVWNDVAFAVFAATCAFAGVCIFCNLFSWVQSLRTVAVVKGLFDNSAAAVFLVDKTGDIKYKNPATKQFHTTHAPTSIIGLLEKLSANPSGEVVRLHALARLRHYVTENYTLNGRPIQFNVSVTDSDHFVWLITFQATAYEELSPKVTPLPAAIPHDCAGGAVSKSALGDVLRDLPIPVLVLTERGAIVEANHDAAALLGRRIHLGTQIEAFLSGLNEPLSSVISTIAGGEAPRVSMLTGLIGRDQEKIYRSTFVPAPQKGLIFAVVTDVPYAKSVDAKFLQNQKMHAIGQLAGGVAHDFNNLLTAIAGHCDLLLLRHDPADASYNDLIQIYQNANRAAALVRQLLAFSRKQNLKFQSVNVRDALTDVTHLLNRLMGEKMELVFQNDKDIRAVRADKKQLEQVLLNLVVNARDAMPKGGKIEIKTKSVSFTVPTERDKTTIPVGDYVAIYVKDEGTGISPEDLPKIFEPFHTTKKPSEGTGLGLSTVYGIVKQTGGFVFVNTALGKGTTFEILLPAPPVARPPASERDGPDVPPIPQSSFAGGKVLLVEDEAPVRAFASRALKLKGFDVIEAASGEEALAMLENDTGQTFDVFVTDVVMPGMDGPTWVRKALKYKPDVRVIFVSGYAEDSVANHGEDLDEFVFLPKPFSLSDLTTTVAQALH